MIIFSVLLFIVEYFSIQVLRKSTNVQYDFVDDDILQSLMASIQNADINHYITYILIYASFLYLGMFFSSILIILLAVQVMSVGMIGYLAAKV
jgi:hypothetical protein